MFNFKDSHMDNDKKYNSINETGPTTIHIPLANGATAMNAPSNVPINITQEVQRTTIWQQIHNDGLTAEQLIIPVNAKVRQINGGNNQSNLLSAVNQDQLTTTSHSNNEDSYVKMDVPNETAKTDNKLDTTPDDVTHV
uniref:Uncharacterized protein n=1 Tax=Glossina palpalis gambiensis TaxID=67801 RepID=A0A1B0BKX0_9MUSC